MQSRSFSGPADLQAMQILLAGLAGKSTLVDFDEVMATRSVQRRTRLWEAGADRLVAFAYVDDYNNLWFEIAPGYNQPTLQAEIVAWGVECVRRGNAESGEAATLDAVCEADAQEHMTLLRAHGFQETGLRTLRYARTLEGPLPEVSLPPGFSLRSARGEQEAGALTALHRAAFGDDLMTVEYRLAMMRSPQYVPELDLVITAPDGELAAFCVCTVDEEENRRSDLPTGWPDPIGVRAGYQGMGLGKAVLSAALHGLQRRGLKQACLGTSSENRRMQYLAESLGFRLIAEKIWFSKSMI